MIPLFEVGPEPEPPAKPEGGTERCRRCKRVLTDEESLGFHIGPVCRERLGIARPKRQARPARWRPGGRFRPPDTQPALISNNQDDEEETVSYDVYLEIDTGAPEHEWPDVVEIGNYTSNVSPMWKEALGGVSLAEFHHKPCSEAAGLLWAAVARMEADPDTYRAMEPANGWGDYEGALAYLRQIAQACAEHPKCRIRVAH